MLVGPDQLVRAFELELLEGDGGIMVFCTNDCDSIAALRILKDVIHNSDKMYSQRVVNSHSDLRQAFFEKVWPKNLDAEAPHEKITKVLMIGCGATFDPIDTFFPQDLVDEAKEEDVDRIVNRYDEIKFFVFDSHRPINLESTRPENRNTLLFCDSETYATRFPEVPPFDEDELENMEDEDDDDDDDEDEDEDEGDDTQDEDSEGSRKRRKSSENDSPSSHIRRSKKKQSKEERMLARREEKEKKLRILEKFSRVAKSYYDAGESYGQSIALLMYDIALGRNHATSELLWYAILGVTDHLIHERTRESDYNYAVSRLKLEVDSAAHHRRGDDDRSRSSSRSRDRRRSSSSRREGEPLSSIENADSQSTSSSSSRRRRDRSSSKKRLRSSEVVFQANELNFPLMRHWTLYDSMSHSSHVASALTIHREAGLKWLKQFLVYLAIPLEEAKRPYRMMKRVQQDQLVKRIETVQSSYLKALMERIFFPSFLKQHGQKEQVSASDMVLAVTALLQESPDEFQTYLKEQLEARKIAFAPDDGGASAAGGTRPQSTRGVEESGVKVIEDRLAIRTMTARLYTQYQQDQLHKNFHRAFDCLRVENFAEFDHGLQLAMETQRAVIEQGQKIIERGQLLTHGPYRQAMVEDCEHRYLFANHRTLMRLGFFLHDSDLHIRKRKDDNRRRKPLIVSCLNDKSHTYLVVGLCGTSFGHFEKNKFSAVFRHAATMSGSRFSQDTFEAHIIEVQEDDWGKFHEYLHSGLSESAING